MRKFTVNYGSVNCSETYKVEAVSAVEAANWLLNNHPQGDYSTISVCGPCHSEKLSSVMKFSNPLYGTETEGESKQENDSKQTTSDKQESHGGHKETEKGPDPENQYASILGLSGEFTIEDIKSAYRRSAAQNHPDKVNNLASDFLQLAERKMKEINKAYEYFKRRHGF